MIGLIKRLLGLPTTSADYLKRGDWHMELGDMDKAVAEYSTAVELDPSNAVAHCKLGLAKLESDWEGAVRAFDEAIRCNAQYADAYYHRGIAYRNNGSPWWFQALADLRRAIQLNPEHANARVAVGVMKSIEATWDPAKSALQLQQALAEFTEAIRLEPANPVLYEMRANVMEALGDTEGAERDRGKANELRTAKECWGDSGA
ncbi:MAG: tetratricopeptide repeat protein [Planctomycetes bacterium]|nr:tetratricopeptide repeat protein [Planctomycetota bacterium]